MNRFLVETGYLPDDDAMLHVFDDIQLVAFLSANVKRQHYEDDGYDIKGIWHYLGAGKLRKLSLKFMTEYRDDSDYLDWSYELTSAGRQDLGDDAELIEFVFTVRIDGRA